MATIYANIDDVILFTESPLSNIKTTGVSQEISFVESAQTQHKFATAIDKFFFTEHNTKTNTLHNAIIDSLIINQIAHPRVNIANVAHVLTLVQSLTNSNLIDKLIINQTATYVLCSGVHDTINLIDSATYTSHRNLIINQTLSLNHGASGYKLHGCIPTEQINTHSVIYTCGLDVLTLPSPDFDNGEKFEYTRVNKRTSGGDLIIFRDSAWPKTRIMAYKWSHLSEIKRQRTLTFIRGNIGKLMVLTDYEGRAFTGIIRNPDTAFSEDQRESHSVGIEFEVE